MTEWIQSKPDKANTCTCHIWYTAFYMQLGVGLNSKQRQRQNTDGFSCKLHLLTLELINTLYYHTVKLEEKHCIKTQKKNPIIIKIHLMTLHSNIFTLSLNLTIHILNGTKYSINSNIYILFSIYIYISYLLQDNNKQCLIYLRQTDYTKLLTAWDQHSLWSTIIMNPLL